jgi:hypothetical protein
LRPLTARAAFYEKDSNMQTPSTTSIWLNEQAWPLLVMFLFIAFLIGTLYISARNRRIKMNEERAGINEDTFVSSLLGFGFDPVIARATYQYLQEKQRVAFPIEASDLLDEDLGLDSDDVEESVVDLLGLTGRLHQPGLRHAPLVTVEDLVRYIQASPRVSERAA